MNLNEIGDLLEKIAIHYPRFRKEIATEEGMMRKSVAEEWYRIIGYMDFGEAIAMLDAYMENVDSQKPPMAADFKKYKPVTKGEEWHSPEPHSWHLVFHRNDPQRMHGRVFDQEDREYVHDPTYEDGYHYDSMGRICTITGRVAFV